MSDKERRKLTDSERIAAVLSSQGRAPRLAAHFSDDQRKRLAALSDEYGTISKETPTRFMAILRELIDQKASVKGLEA
jgi:hypothetical protein